MSGFVTNLGAKLLEDGTVTWGTSDIRVALATASFTPSKDHDTLAQLTNELVGAGYVRKTVDNRTSTEDDTNNRTAYDADDVVWSTIGVAAGVPRWAAVYWEGAGGADSARKILGYVDVLGLITPNSGSITLKWGTTGILLLSSTSGLYNRGSLILGNGTAPWATADIRLLLTTASYTPSRAHNTLLDVTNELTGGNYVRKLTTGRTVIEDDTGDRTVLDLDDLTWTALQLAAGVPRYAVFFWEGLGTEATRQLIGWVDLAGSSDPNGGNWLITWSADGAIDTAE